MLSFDIGLAIKKTGSSLDPKLLEAFIRVESGGKGYDEKTGRIKIQFEPVHFEKRTGIKIQNKIDVQSREWEAFNKAYDLHPIAAMESTSIGLPQIMGFHWKRLGYDSVADMWSSFKESLVEQICGLIKFIETDKNLIRAFQEKDFHKLAYFYNGAGYMRQAHQLGIKPYNEQIRDTYQSLLKV